MIQLFLEIVKIAPSTNLDVAEWSCHQAGNLSVRGGIQTPAAPGNLWPRVAKKIQQKNIPSFTVHL